MAEKAIRDHIKKMDPYEPIIPLDIRSKKLGIPIGQLVKLDANENPYGMPPTARKRLADLQFGHIYPDPESLQLRQRLSEFLGIPTENILAGAGADELIDLIVRVSMNPGDKIINCPPTFGFYDAVAQINNLNRVNIPRKSDFSIHVDGILNAAEQGAKLLFLANPNNPDGGCIPLDILQDILETPLMVVIDEAYVEFARQGTTLINQVRQRDNLIVLRTFSKWGGLAGLRLGYGVFPDDLLKAIMKIKQPYNVSVAASEAGLGALEDINKLNDRLGRILSERSRLCKLLEECNWLIPYPTQANFILCRVLGRDAEKLQQTLAQRGILIRYFHTEGLRDHVRFSIGKPEDTDRLMDALKEV